MLYFQLDPTEWEHWRTNNTEKTFEVHYETQEAEF